MVAASLFIFLGDDEAGKRQRIASLQKELFPPELKDFNLSIIYGDDKRLTAQSFKELLMFLPTEGAQRRLFIIKMAHKLKKPLLLCLKKNLEKMRESTVVVVDIDELKSADMFVNEFSGFNAEVVRFKMHPDLNIFDLGRAILKRQPEEALRVLSGFMQNRERTDKILGAMFWQWDNAYSKGQIAQQDYDKGLRFILEADKKLKSTSSAFARQTLILETLVVKLSYLT